MVNWSVRKRYLKCIQLCNFVEFWHFYMKVWEDRKTVCLANCFVWTATTSCRTNKRLSNKINKRKYVKENKSWDKRSHTQTQVTKHNLTHTHTYCTHISIRLTARYIVTNIWHAPVNLLSYFCLIHLTCWSQNKHHYHILVTINHLLRSECEA